MKYYVLILVLLLPLNLNGQSPDTTTYKVLDPYYFHLNFLITESSLLIDVREPFEYRRRRLADALNIPISGNIDIAADTIDTGTVLFLYCTTEYRSSRAATRLYQKGFKEIYLLEGGITYWREEGYPIEKGRPKRKK
jgi:rhodanese-related sulfurtransferase